MESREVDCICESGALYHGKKLQLLSDTTDPENEFGYNLLVVEERKAIVLLIEFMKQSILNKELLRSKLIVLVSTSLKMRE
jgi:hypothetical protein